MHIIWDWNGTLFDDLSIVVSGVNESLAAIGESLVIDEDGYRDYYRRPVRAFYDAMLARTISDEEWETVNRCFQDDYFAAIERAAPSADAYAAIAEAAKRHVTQSILSMWTHSLLGPTVDSYGLGSAMVAVRGSVAGEGATKDELMRLHLGELGPAGSGKVVMVGDTFDDAAAATAAGVGAVFYNGGSHHRAALEATGLPVADTLCDAVDLAAAL